MSNRAFGVEIECYAPDGYGDTYGYSDDGVGWTEDFLSEKGFEYWAHLVAEDESLYERGVEIKSPILVGENGFKELKSVMTVLNEAQFDVNSTCGFHVHLDCPEYIDNPKLIIKTVKAWMRNQEIINNMVADNRLKSGHCPAWTEDDLTELVTWLDEYNSCDGTNRGTINVGALDIHGSIEIRQHEGTLNYEEAESWIKFCQAFIDSMSGTTVQKISTEELLLKRLKVERNASRFLTTKARHNKERRARLSA